MNKVDLSFCKIAGKRRRLFNNCCHILISRMIL